MNKYFFILAVVFITSITVKAQQTVEYPNPLTEVRFNFFKNSVLLFNEYLNTDSGSLNTTSLRILHPIGNRSWLLRVDVPLVSVNTSIINKSGLGDVAFAASYIPYVKNKTGIAVRAKVTSNSAVDPNFGTGKWVFTPTLFLGNYLGNHKKYLWMSSIENQISFAGDTDRNKINTSIFENTLLYFLGKNWFGINTALQYNHIKKGFQNTAFIEFGRKFTDTYLFYLHPSVGYGGIKTYNYGGEFGVVILF